jgi:L-asparaginase
MGTIHIITTGGTIAMRHQESAGGAIPLLSADDFLAALPADLPALTVEEFCNLPSAHFTVDTLWGIRQQVMAAVSQPDVDGVVISHGTDVLEETAYLLDLTVDSLKPVVVTGAMRAASQVGYEGTANLVAAVRVAADPAARALGTLVVLNDEIHAARFVAKFDTQALDTFRSWPWGPVGRVYGDRVGFQQRVTPAPLTIDHPEPDVHLLTLAVGCDAGLLEFLIQRRVRGVVIAALGGGRVPPWWMPVIRRAVSWGTAVVIASRCPGGRVYDAYGYSGAYRDWLAAGAIAAPALNGPKARIRLMVALGQTNDPAAVAQIMATS